MTLHEWYALSTINIWPDMGLPRNGLDVQISSMVEGDPRGDISVEDANKAVQVILDYGWGCVGGDGFVRPMITGMNAFSAEKEERLKGRRDAFKNRVCR